MSAKHTPGPWALHNPYLDPNIDCPCIVQAAGDYEVCDVLSWDRDEESARANAHLIAAAPDMLDIIKQLVDWSNGETLKTIEITQAARDILRAVVGGAE